MPPRRQSKRRSHTQGNRSSSYPTRVQTRPCTRTAKDGIDPPLFALVTTLPVTCFPTDDVHPGARYGALDEKFYAIQRNAPKSKVSTRRPHAGRSMCILSGYGAQRPHWAERRGLTEESTSSAFHTSSRSPEIMSSSNIEEPCPNWCWMDENQSNAISLLSGPVMFSTPSNGVLNEPAAESGILGSFDAKLPRNGQGAFAPQHTTADALSAYDSTVNDCVYTLTKHRGSEQAAGGLGAGVPQQLVSFDDSQMPWSSLLSGLPIDHPSGGQLELAATLEKPFVPAAALSLGSKRLSKPPAFLISEDEHISDEIPFTAASMLAKSLTEERTAIDCDVAESSHERLQYHIDFNDFPNVLNGCSIPEQCRHDHQKRHLDDAADLSYVRKMDILGGNTLHSHDFF